MCTSLQFSIEDALLEALIWRCGELTQLQECVEIVHTSFLKNVFETDMLSCT